MVYIYFHYMNILTVCKLFLYSFISSFFHYKTVVLTFSNTFLLVGKGEFLFQLVYMVGFLEGQIYFSPRS